MKTKEELFKIYSACLPYDLKIGFEGEDLEHSLVGLDMTNAGLQLISPYGDFGRSEIYVAKPILYSMDMLTQEIEHKGKRFVPIVELAKIVSFYEVENIDSYSKSGDAVIYFTDAKGYKRGLDIMFSQEGYLQFNFYTRESKWAKDWSSLRIDHMKVTGKLLEWHFNVFGLEESEYIKKESLNCSENPNS